MRIDDWDINCWLLLLKHHIIFFVRNTQHTSLAHMSLLSDSLFVLHSGGELAGRSVNNLYGIKDIYGNQSNYARPFQFSEPPVFEVEP